MKKTITIEVELNNVKEFRDEDTKEIVSESVGQGLVEAVCKYISEKISVYADKESKEFDVMDEQLLNESGEDWLCEGPESLSEYGDFTIKIK